MLKSQYSLKTRTMKKLLVAVFLLSSVVALHAQEVIENPRYGISSSGNVRLTRVELNGEATILSFHVKIPQHNWVAIHEKSYIQPVGDTTRLYITKAEGAEIETRIQWVKDKREEISYRLFFPPLNKEFSRIDFGEPVANSWNIYDIEVREMPDTSPVPPVFLGHWFSEEDGQWTFSLLDSLAIYDGKAWNYENVSSTGNDFKIILKNDEGNSMLLGQKGGEASLIVHSDNNASARYSKNVKLLDKISDPGPFNVSSLNRGKVVYSGWIRGYSTRLGVQTGMMRWMNRLTNQQESCVVPIQKNGSFCVEFSLNFPQEITVSLPSGSERVFFEPGKPLFHLANTGIESLPSLFAGESAAVNYGLYKTRDVGVPMMEFINPILGMSDAEYIDYVMETKKKELEKLEDINRNGSLSAKAYQINRLGIDYRAVYNALRFNGNMNLAKIYANRDLKKEDQLPMSSVEFDKNLLQKFKDTPLNDELAIISNDYFNAIQAIVYTDLKRQQSAYYYQLAELGAELKRQGKSLTGEENDMLEYINLNLKDSFDYEKSMLFNQTYLKLFQKFTQKHQAEMQQVTARLQKENLKTNLAAMGMSEVNLPREIIESQSYITRLMNENQAPDEEEYRKTTESLQNIRIKELVMSAYYRKKAEMEIKDNASVDVPEKEGDLLFNSIINPYKGKVIYVDFWATWCGPCLSGIERIKPLKEEMAQKDIVFLYITNPSSPEAEYRKRIPEIKGEHVRVSNDEWNYLIEKFNIFGIPHYALVDKTGKIVDAHMMHMDNDMLKERLMEQLEKQ